jgi:hypothetical protein
MESFAPVRATSKFNDVNVPVKPTMKPALAVLSPVEVTTLPAMVACEPAK